MSGSQILVCALGLIFYVSGVLSNFKVLILLYLTIFILMCFIVLLEAFSNERERENESGLREKGRYGETGRSRGRENPSQDILY